MSIGQPEPAKNKYHVMEYVGLIITKELVPDTHTKITYQYVASWMAHTITIL
jgi:hypothetical protein